MEGLAYGGSLTPGRTPISGGKNKNKKNIYIEPPYNCCSTGDRVKKTLGRPCLQKGDHNKM